VGQSASFACSTLSVCLPLSLSLCTPLSYTSDLHEQRGPNSGRFCASTITCPRGPVNFSRLLCTLSLSALYPPSFLHYCHHISCCHTSVYLYELFPILMAEVGIKPIPRWMPKSYPNDQKIENKNSNTCQCNCLLSFENRARTNSRNVICTSYINFKFRVFYDVAPCSHVEVDRRLRCAYCLHRPGDGGSTHLWNVGTLQLDYTALHPRRL
jgi:hypothetical protein